MDAGTIEKTNKYLKMMFGPEARFREGQLEAISSVLDKGGKHLVIQKTGWGKSVVYFILTRILRDQGKGPTMLISPLLALMRNQIINAQKLGLVARSINSSNKDDWDSVVNEIKMNRVDLLLVAPERLSNEMFLTEVLPHMKGIGLFVVDEVHCVSDWGHDFRPDYRRIRNIIQKTFSNVPVLGTTATANDRVIKDIEEQFGSDVRTLRGPLARKGLKLQNIVLGSVAERLAWLAQNVPSLPGSGVIYCLTRKDVFRVSEWLKMKGIDSEHYWGGAIPGDDGGDKSEELELRLLNNRIKVLVATSALGMGYDKPDLGFVIHYQAPGSAISYYQQVGRAGRAVPESYGILLHGREEEKILGFFMNESFPAVEESLAILDHLHSVPETTLGELQKSLNLKHNRLEKALKHLEIDGFISKNRSQYTRTIKPWKYDSDRIDTVKTVRREERKRLKDYIYSPDCLMKFITSELDDPNPSDCGICRNCRGELLAEHPPKELIHEALEFLSQDYEIIDPRKMWPGGLSLSMGANGKMSSRLPVSEIVEQGRALCSLEDAGWGPSVMRHISENTPVDDDILEACGFLIIDKWYPEPFPEWITIVPSAGRGRLLTDFATRLSEVLGIPFINSLRIAGPRQQMAELQNSAQKVMKSIDSWELIATVPRKPVLLIDDFTDSKWTFTITGRMLKRASVPFVYPFALGVKKEAG